MIRILRPAVLTGAHLVPWDWCASDRVGTLTRRVMTAFPYPSPPPTNVSLSPTACLPAILHHSRVSRGSPPTMQSP